MSCFQGDGQIGFLSLCKMVWAMFATKAQRRNGSQSEKPAFRWENFIAN